MEVLPPNLREWLEAETNRTSEADEKKDEADYARDQRKDRHLPPNEYFAGDKDNKGEIGGDDDGRRIRGGARRGAGRKPRGRGRGRGITKDEGNESDKSNTMEVVAAPVAPVKRGRGRGRKRGRGGRPANTVSSEAESNAMSE